MFSIFGPIWAIFLKNQNLNWKANGHIGGQTNIFQKFSMLFFCFLLFSYFPFLFPLVHFYDVFESSSKNLSYVSMLQTNKKDKETKQTSKKERKQREERKERKQRETQKENPNRKKQRQKM